jgi:hypothetical protein
MSVFQLPPHCFPRLPFDALTQYIVGIFAPHGVPHLCGWRHRSENMFSESGYHQADSQKDLQIPILPRSNVAFGNKKRVERKCFGERAAIA